MIPKFRAWDKKRGMYDVTWIHFDDNEIGVKREMDGYINKGKLKLNEVILMQSTGLFDKNNVEIFEGDIVRGFANDYTPIYQNGIYMAYNVDNVNAPHVSTQFNVIWRDGCEVVGNIHESMECDKARRIVLK